MTFRLHALPFARFAPLFALDEASLASHRARRVIADGPGYPCRVSLEDAAPGETLILTHFVHQPAETPFHASHAIFVREAAVPADPAVGEVPEQLRRRTLSLRAFDAHGMLVGADLAEGSALEPALEPLLARPDVAEVHLHNARHGCYLARATRA